MSAIAKKIVTPLQSDGALDALFDRMEPYLASREAGRAGGSIEQPDFKLFTITPSDCAIEPHRPYVIKGFIARGDHVALIGQPGSGKSTLAPYLGYCVALGSPAFEHRTRQGAVLYLAAENASGIKARVAALRNTLGDTDNFYIQPKPVDLLNVFCVAEVERLAQEIKPSLIILDTLAAGFPGLVENDAAPMAKAVGTIRRIANWSDAAVLTLHHPPKTGETGKGAATTPRGSGILLADLDGLLEMSGRGADVRNVVVTKNRNGAADIRFAFTLGAHRLGIDEDGDDITAPIAIPHARTRDPRETLNSRQRAALEIIEGLISNRGVALPDQGNFPACTTGIRTQDATEACAIEAVSGAARLPDRRVGAEKVIAQVIAKGALRREDGFIWIVECEGAAGVS